MNFIVESLKKRHLKSIEAHHFACTHSNMMYNDGIFLSIENWLNATAVIIAVSSSSSSCRRKLEQNTQTQCLHLTECCEGWIKIHGKSEKPVVECRRIFIVYCVGDFLKRNFFSHFDTFLLYWHCDLELIVLCVLEFAKKLLFF